MTIADKFNYLNNTKKAIKDALIDKGVEVSDSDSFRSYADKVASIETGGESGAEITEVRCDPANFPVQAEKKVILAYTGEQPAAEKNLLAPFDYKTTWSNVYVTPLQNSEYDFIMQTTNNALAYKKENETYALTHIVSTGTTSARLALGKYNLFLSADAYTSGYCLAKRFNRQAEVEDIIFDVEPDVPTGDYTSTYLRKVILPTYDDKYIWVFYRYDRNSAVATSQPKIYIYKLRYVEDEDKLYADKISEYTQSVETTYPIYNAIQSANDYTFLFEYSGRREWLQFNAETNTIEFKASSGSTTNVTFLKKDWFINASGNVYTYELLADGTCSQTKTNTLLRAYYMEPFEGVLWNRSDKWLVYDTVPTSGNIKEVSIAGVPYRDRIILGYDTTFNEIFFKKILDDGTIEDISVPDPYGEIYFIDDDGRIRGKLKGSTSTTVTQPVDGSYTNGIQETSKIYVSGSDFRGMGGGHLTGIKNGKSLIYGNSYPKFLKGFNSEVKIDNNYLYYVFEDAVVFTGGPSATPGVTDTKIYKITDDYEVVEYSNSGSLFKRYAFKINETYFFITVKGSVYKVVFNEDDLTYTPELLYQDSSLSFSSSFYPDDVINTKDGRYVILPEADKYFEISGTESEPKVQLKDFPEVLKTSLTTSIRFVQAFYDKTFGIQLYNGSYLMCRYNEGIDIDLSVEEYAPRIYDKRNQTIMYYTQNKNYWMSYISSTSSPYLTAYAVGKGLTIPSHYKMTAFPNTSTYYNNGILTGFMTGEVVKEDETGSKIIKVRTALPEEGATPINYSDIVNCYVSGVALGQPELNSTGTELEPSSVCDVDVLLTNVGYQATGSETLSPEVRVSFLTEYGYAMVEHYGQYVVNLHVGSRYDIIDGEVKSDSGTQNYTNYGSFYGQVLPFFFNNGTSFVECEKYSTGGMKIATSSPGQAFYNYNLSSPINLKADPRPTTFLDCGVVTGDTKCLNILDEEGNVTTYNLLDVCTDMMGSSSDICPPFVFAEGDSKFWVYYTTGYLMQNKPWKLVKLERAGSSFTVTEIRADPTVTNYPTLENYMVLLQTKSAVNTNYGYILPVIHENGYIQFTYNRENESDSSVSFHSYPQPILDTIGTRTIHKMQAFYDGTFSFDLSDGTTLICAFAEVTGVPYITEIIEPYVVSDDTNVYHRTFTENRLYWYQRPEASSAGSSGYALAAPTTALPYGPYNATKATVDWLAIPREQSRFNSTVLTGVIRQDAQTAKPVFDDTGRRVLQVETTIKNNNCNDNATYKWTLEDYDKVNG